MDANANLNEQREIARRLVNGDYAHNDLPGEPDDSAEVADAERLAELVLALDEWREGGGFDPYAKPAGEATKPSSLLHAAADALEAVAPGLAADARSLARYAIAAGT